MSRDKGYLRTLTCSISFSSCRVRAEAIARALNSRLWFRQELPTISRRDSYERLRTEPSVKSNSCLDMTNVVDKPPRTQETFIGNDGSTVGHIWVNEMPVDEDECFDTPPCSSPPSPVDDEIIMNPPFNTNPLPFCTKLLKDFGGKNDYRPTESNRNHSIFSEESKLRDKLQQYADGLLSADEGIETFYDANDDEHKADCLGLSKEHLNIAHDPEHCTDLNNTAQEDYASTEVVETVTAISENCTNELTTEEKEVSDSSELSECPTLKLYNSDGHATSLEDSHFEGSGNDLLYLTDSLVNRRIIEVQEVEVEGRPRLLRSTSLKTGKTPPGTPGRKKIVRFADALGLDLEAVRHIVCDDLPHVPSSAFSDLNLTSSDFHTAHENTERRKVTSGVWETVPTQPGLGLSSLFPLFRVPGADPDFIDRVRRQRVCLETIHISQLNIHCICRILNIAYEKHVTVRYTTNSWRTWEEVVASYVPFSSDGEFDRFAFSLYLQPGLCDKRELSFAICLSAQGTQHWDNNHGQDYTLRYHCGGDTTSAMLPSEEETQSWLHHFF